MTRVRIKELGVAVDAVRVLGYDTTPFSESPWWLVDALEAKKIRLLKPRNSEYPEWEIDTEKGTVLATTGDYIIHGVNGELYASKPEEFDTTYELI